MAVYKVEIGHFSAFCLRIPGRCLFAFSPGYLARLGECGWIFDLFYKKGPGNIAAFRLKIGRTYTPLQPLKATWSRNLNRLFWPLPRWRQTFGLVCLAGQQNMFQQEFLAHFRTQGRAYTHVFAEVFRYPIAYIKKSYGRSKICQFLAFLLTQTWEVPFHICAGKPG